MDYQRDQFLRLIEAVEDQGGTHLDETCSMTSYDEWTGKQPKEPVKPYYYPGCGHNTLFEIPVGGREDAVGMPTGPTGRGILPEEGIAYLGLPDSLGPVKVCAVEDCLGEWPRFKDQVME